VPGAVGRVPDGMAASVLAGVNPVHGLYASFAALVRRAVPADVTVRLIESNGTNVTLQDTRNKPGGRHDKVRAPEDEGRAR
jgi:hypothetical protein